MSCSVGRLCLTIAAVWACVAVGPGAQAARAQTITEFSAGITPGAAPQGIAAGPDGNLWFTEFGNNAIGRITPSGTVTEFTAGISPGATPNFITAGPDGSLWYTMYGPGTQGVGTITTLGAVTEYTAGITPGSFPWGITAGPDGNLWFAEEDDDQVGRITTAGTATEFGGIGAGAAVTDITAGPDGNLWFTEYDLDQIGRITPAGVVTEFSAGISPGADPTGITAGPDGNLWFTEAALGQIGRITPAGVVTEFSAGITPTAAPNYIAAGPDGNLWFTEPGIDAIGRITPAGVVTEFSAGITPGAGLIDIAAGPDGNMWFTELNLDRIGRITVPLAAPPDPPGPPAPPVQGQSANLTPVSGTILVKLPGSGTFIPISEARSIPIGTIVDSRNGVVELTAAADKSGNTQTAQFKFGLFRVAQSGQAGAYTELRLTGPLLGCGKKKGKKKANRIAHAAAPVATVAARGRRLWGKGSGRFRTSGSRGSGAARGTTWQVSDRCNRSTEIRSIEGRVEARDFARKSKVILKGGQRYVAPGPKSKKR